MLWKERDKAQPGFVPIILTCAHCKREVKMWVLNKDLRKIYAELQLIEKRQELIEKRQERQESLLKEILKELKSKNWFERILERILERA